MDIKNVVDELCKLYPGGRMGMAEALGMSMQKFQNKFYQKNGCRFFALSELEQMEDVVGVPLLANYFAKRRGGVFVKYPEVDNIDKVELFDISVNVDAKKALLSLLISESIEDGVIDENEQEKILNSLHIFLGSKMTEIMALIELYKKKN